MKSEFIQPRFDGARFEEHTLPLEVAKDLAAYETLVVELAKHLYLQDHKERQRVPKGFASDFHLHLVRIEEGSTRPVLAMVKAAGLVAGLSAELFANEIHSETAYFERARDLIARCIASDGKQLPPEFPRHLLTHFNSFGRSLQPGESVQLSKNNGDPAVLTPERRRNLVLAADKVYEKDDELTGTIGEADWEKSTFRLRLLDGSQVTVPMPESFHNKARKYGGRIRHQVIVKCTASYDSWDRLQKVVSVESLDILPDYQLTARFEELAGLSDGWYEGAGIAPDKQKLTLVSANMAGRYPENLPLPFIVPTPEGNLLLEWNLPDSPSVDIELGTMKAAFHAFAQGDKEIECTFDLSQEEQWEKFFGFLCEHIGQVQA